MEDDRFDMDFRDQADQKTSLRCPQPMNVPQVTKTRPDAQVGGLMKVPRRVVPVRSKAVQPICAPPGMMKSPAAGPGADEELGRQAELEAERDHVVVETVGEKMTVETQKVARQKTNGASLARPAKASARGPWCAGRRTCPYTRQMKTHDADEAGRNTEPEANFRTGRGRA